MSAMQPIVTISVVEKPKQAHFYVPPSLRKECEAVFEQQGVTFSEGITRLVRLLVEAPEAIRPLLLGQAPGDAATAIAKAVLNRQKQPPLPMERERVA